MKKLSMIVVSNDDALISLMQNEMQESEFDLHIAIRKESIYSADYDVILIDGEQNPEECLGTCSLYRENGGTAVTVLILRSTDAYTKVSSLEAGFDFVLPKPLAIPELKARVTARLRRPLKVPTAKIELQSVELDTVRRTVRKNGRLMPLSVKECELLNQLFLNPNQVISSGQLSGKDNDCRSASDDTIRQRVRLVRRKLAAIGADDLIMTVANSGYLIVNNPVA